MKYFYFFIFLFFGEVFGQDNNVVSITGDTSQTSLENLPVEDQYEYFLVKSKQEKDRAKGVEYAKKALVLAKLTKNKKFVADANFRLGYHLRFIGKNHESIEAFFRALDIYEEVGIRDDIFVTHHAIGFTQALFGNYEKAIESTKKSIEVNMSDLTDIDSVSIENSLTNIGETFRLLGQYDSAKYYMNEALKMNKLTGHRLKFSYTAGNLGMVYAAQGIEDSAIFFLKKSMKITKEMNEWYPFSVYQGCYAELLIKNGNRTTGEALLKESLAIAQRFSLTEQMRDFNEDLYLFYKEEGDFKKALSHYEEYYLYRDSIRNVEKVKKTERTVAGYELEKREEKIDDLSTANDLKQNIIMAVVSGLVLLLVLLYLIYRSNQREKITNKALQKSKGIIEESLAEKEVLIREIHHRVKNNLQIISSLLELQSFSESDKQVQNAIQKSQKRLQSIALIHQELYQQDNLAKVNLKEYLDKLITTLLAFFTDTSTRVDVKTNISEIEYDIEKAAPIGLIINELITNAYKYAFEERDSGRINISVSLEESGQLNLLFSDDGKGLPEDFDLKKAKSLGLRLISILTKQIKGKVSFYNDGGAHFDIRVPQSI